MKKRLDIIMAEWINHFTRIYIVYACLNIVVQTKILTQPSIPKRLEYWKIEQLDFELEIGNVYRHKNFDWLPSSNTMSKKHSPQIYLHNSQQLKRVINTPFEAWISFNKTKSSLSMCVLILHYIIFHIFYFFL